MAIGLLMITRSLHELNNLDRMVLDMDITQALYLEASAVARLGKLLHHTITLFPVT